MARTKLVNGERIPFTPEEEMARDAEEATPRVRTVTKSRYDVLCDALIAKGVLSQEEIEAAKR